MNRENYKGLIYGMDKGIVFPLDLTVEQIQQALEENKKMKELQEKYDSLHQLAEDMSNEIKGLRDGFSKIREIISPNGEY